VAVKCVLIGVLILIAARALCLGFAASSQSGIVSFIFNASEPLVAPFQSIVPDRGTSTNIIEFASLLAIVVFSLVGLGFVQVLRILATPRGIKPPTMKESQKSPFYKALGVLSVLAYCAGGFVVIQDHIPHGADSLASASVGTGGSSSGGGGGGSSGGGSGRSGGGSSGGFVTAPTSAATPQSHCAVSVIASQGGVSWYRRVNTTSTAPCYSHWTVGEASGPDCGFWVNGARYSPPANIWNIVQWGQRSGDLYAILHDGNSVVMTCVVNLGNYPQTSLYPSDFR
jgi:uncharacterized protein YggT (Ycf19 family)